MTITREEYLRREAAGLIRRPLTWPQSLRMHQSDADTATAVAGTVRSSPLDPDSVRALAESTR